MITLKFLGNLDNFKFRTMDLNRPLYLENHSCWFC